MSKMKKFLNKQLLITLIITLAIPISVFLVKQQQDLRERAQESPIARLYFTLPNETEPLEKIQPSPEETITLHLFLNTPVEVSAFDVKLIFDPGEDISKVVALEDVSNNTFDVPLFKNINSGDGTIRFAKINSSPEKTITGLVHLANLTITMPSRGTGYIQLPFEATSPNGLLNGNSMNLTYEIASGTGQETITYNLTSGLNLTGIPILTQEQLSVQNLLDQTNGACTEVHQQDGALSASSPITEGNGYFIQCSAPATISLQGLPYRETRIPSGTQFISLTFGKTIQADSYLQEISSLSGLNCTEVSRWVNGAWESHLAEIPQVNNFEMNDREGYLLRCPNSP